MEEVQDTSLRQRVSSHSKGECSSSQHSDASDSSAEDRQLQENEFSGLSPPETCRYDSSNFSAANKLGAISKEARMAFEQLHEKFSLEYRSLLESAVNSAARVQNGFDTSVPDRVNFSFTSSKSQERVTKKRFTTRDSVLTELLKINHIRTVYNIFAAILIIFSVQTVVYDFLEEGRIKIDFGLISWGFGKFSLVISIWLFMMTSTTSLYPLFNIWIQSRHRSRKWVDRGFFLLYVLYQAGFLVLPVYTLAEYDLPPISTLVVVIEQVRMIMKAHSFIRENVARELSSKDEVTKGLDFSRYLYFLFAPTLIYRDEYPRTLEINWTSVVFDVFQLVICIFYTYYIFMRFCIPNFHNFNRDHVTVKSFVVSMFGCMMPGTLVLLIGFFAILHCWLNAWAEMLTFGDRLFYKDWWNCTNFSGYYRNWNVVVHDWLFSYVYQDVYMLLGFRRHLRWLAMYSTFFLSAAFHEYILVVALRFFYPVLFVLFAIVGVGFMYVTSGVHERSSNIFMWVMLFAGNGVLMCLYSVEYFSRKNCPPVIEDSFVDYLIPRSLFCEANASSLAATGNFSMG
ncbi:sterol O-acyltransferase 1-like [Watersipora subatra]|uniref:sterol O-acyltransferase 1-like n=1 Tax=Watersipora subatra TaxID=2589382 RepID=UPI00355C2737